MKKTKNGWSGFEPEKQLNPDLKAESQEDATLPEKATEPGDGEWILQYFLWNTFSFKSDTRNRGSEIRSAWSG